MAHILEVDSLDLAYKVTILGEIFMNLIEDIPIC